MPILTLHWITPNPALVEHFPRSVKRAATIEEVKDFLRLQLAPSP